MVSKSCSGDPNGSCLHSVPAVSIRSARWPISDQCGPTNNETLELRLNVAGEIARAAWIAEFVIPVIWCSGWLIQAQANPSRAAAPLNAAYTKMQYVFNPVLRTSSISTDMTYDSEEAHQIVEGHRSTERENDTSKDRRVTAGCYQMLDSIEPVGTPSVQANSSIGMREKLTQRLDIQNSGILAQGAVLPSLPWAWTATTAAQKWTSG
ncbi:uncharacterized protein LAESUDRAFT_714498 [Laetiporus sulphureus 93-53]|uniref:Uncharacterized protein n=1 Tax=Laetiporus sulphureus 93-53 TaxID=1314785 RepID=A0A165E2S2_9APHY|nr:uncharacterized protein LAESUDRAFT_714498 [Laetiporus sulphureus 93-53]KZT06135.1 hypothetical protein LAESUDRAFT_714498 [Laetiporus sulphureus 93-53]